MKRLFDLLVALAGLLILAPVFLVIAGAVRLSSRGPVLFRQERVGCHGRPFLILKFRTMVQDAEQRGPQLTAGDDARVTGLGAVLRHYKLDELPQLLNVLRGDMSLVGPRPEVPRYVAQYTPAQRRVLEVRPGITDPASVAFRNEAAILAQAKDPERYYIECIMPEKLRMNLEYLDRRSFWLDLRLIVQTVLVAIRG